MLKSLELTGFKSFADRTVFRFDAGLTAVVGPNGSGKSNVVDGLKWLLGDQSPKSLRGKEMADVIFNGAAGRKPAGSAEAVLTFDNTTRFLPVEDDTVTVGRRLLRSGDSEYRLNGEVARLKDVRSVFAGTGFGSSTYAIIEQGRVDQIIRANATGRRAVFEEVAGIARFRLARADAERKLERVDQNLERLTDVVDELEAQLSATRTQAAKAASYREIRKELRDWWVGWAADEARLTTIVEREAGRAVADAAAGSRRLAARRDRLADDLRRAEEEVAAVEPAFREQDRAATAAAARVEQLDASGAELRARAASLAEDLPRARLRVAAASSAVAEADAERDRLDRTIESLAASLAMSPEETAATPIAADRGDLDVAVDRVEAELERSDAERRSREAERARAEATLDRARHARSLAEQAAEEAEAELRRSESALASLGRLARHREAVADAAVESHAVVTDRANSRHARREAVRGEILKLEARVAALAELDPKPAAGGPGLDAAEILARGRKFEEPPWCDVRGSVADLLDVPLADAAVVDVALGPRAGRVVVDRLDRIAAYLSKHAGRVSERLGFVEVGETSGRAGGPELGGLAGVLGRLPEVIDVSDESAGLFERLLGTTWLVASVDVAIALAGGHGRGQRFVTRSGELVEADGCLTLGPPEPRARLVTRSSERRTLNERIAELQGELTRPDDGGNRDEEAAAGLATAARDAALRAAAVARSEAEAAVERIEVTRRRTTRSDDERAVRAADVRHAEEAVAAADETLASLAERAASLEARAEHLRKCREEAASATGVARDATREAASERARLEERHAAATAARTRLEDDLVRRRQQAEQAADDLRRVENSARETSLACLSTRAERDARTADRDDAGVRAAELGGRLRKARTANDRVRTVASATESELTRLRGYESTATARIGEARTRSETLAARVAEEFDVEAELLTTEPLSALALLAADGKTDGVAEADADPRDLFDHRTKIERRVDRLRKKLKAIGAVNPDSLADLDALEERHARLAGQLADLTEARAALRGVIERLDVESRRLFSETFEVVRGHFADLFRQVFGGGEGDIVLEDPTDPLAGGVEIVARPPGKEPRGLSLLSGGEKTMTCVALMFALFRARPSPFCVLDEVDAALDEANIERFVRVLELFKRETQFVMITHRKPSMVAADVLHGVTMEEAGVSKRLAIRLDDVAEDGAIGPSRKAA